MKIIILGDCHFGVKQSSDIVALHQRRFFDSLIDYGNKNNIKTIIQLGDIFDQRKNINVKSLKTAYCVFSKLRDHGFTFHTLIGNHDIFYRDTLEITSSELLLGEESNFENIKVYKEPTTVDFDGCQIDLIPWICSSNEEKCLSFIANSKSPVCCGHFEINTFPVLFRIEFHGGMELQTFRKYKRVFSGHFHIPSQKDNIVYVGTPYQLTWADVESKNGFWVFDTETFECIQVLNDDVYYKILRYNDKEKGVTTKPTEVNLKDCYVKIIAENRTNQLLFNWYLNKIYEQNPAEVKIVDSDFQFGLDEIGNIDETTLKLSTIDIINQYVDSMEIGFKEPLRTFLANLYTTAMTQSEEE